MTKVYFVYLCNVTEFYMTLKINRKQKTKCIVLTYKNGNKYEYYDFHSSSNFSRIYRSRNPQKIIH